MVALLVFKLWGKHNPSLLFEMEGPWKFEDEHFFLTRILFQKKTFKPFLLRFKFLLAQEWRFKNGQLHLTVFTGFDFSHTWTEI